jgi:membrane protein DedA with SNARE-associated domain
MTLTQFTDAALQHGGVALFVLLAAGIVGLPIPDETLLISTGFLLTRGKLPLATTLIYAYAGSICGISVSYIIGRSAGTLLIKKYGHWIGLRKNHIERAQQWFNRIGWWALFIGYYIPGVRHLTGYTAGALQLSWKKFALFAYSGAIVWVSTFLTVGYIFARSKH